MQCPPQWAASAAPRLQPRQPARFRTAGTTRSLPTTENAAPANA